MPAYHLILRNTAEPDARRVDFEAQSVDQAFQFARNRSEEIEVELWEGTFCHVRMTNGGSHLWKLHGESEGLPVCDPSAAVAQISPE